MNTLTAPIVDGAALIERFEYEVMQDGNHSLHYKYEFSRVKNLLWDCYHDMMPSLALRANALRHFSDNHETRELKRLWKMFFRELGTRLGVKTPPDNFDFDIWADWIWTEAGF
jgi:hypothetical protein